MSTRASASSFLAHLLVNKPHESGQRGYARAEFAQVADDLPDGILELERHRQLAGAAELLALGDAIDQRYDRDCLFRQRSCLRNDVSTLIRFLANECLGISDVA